jgi:putative tryptophan/tyrosine transport system substrate-binding protein
MIERRTFIAGLGAAAAWPLAARGQQAALPVVGYLGTESPALFTRQVSAFQQGLGEMGYAEGRNISIEYRWSEGRPDRLRPLAADLVSHGVSVIATNTPPGALAAREATTTIPVVVLTAVDPVAWGVVASLDRPGGNITGVTTLNVEVDPKQLELMHELIPRSVRIAVLVNPASPGVGMTIESFHVAARTLGREVEVLQASNEPELDAVFANFDRRQLGGLVIGAQSFFNLRHERIAALALRYSAPTIFNYREFAAAGGLMSYGGSNTEGWRLVGVYTGRILKGDKPSDLPFQQETRVQLVINMKTAKRLGVTFPISILGRADEVIE